jgi:hypothetical protein
MFGAQVTETEGASTIIELIEMASSAGTVSRIARVLDQATPRYEVTLVDNDTGLETLFELEVRKIDTNL